MSIASAATKSREALSQQVRARRRLDQAERLALALILLLAAVIAVLAPFQAAGVFQTPFPGVLLEAPLTVSGSILEPAPDGLRDQDTVLAVEGTPVSGGRDFTRALAGYAPGQRITLDVRGADGAVRQVSVLLSEPPLSRLLLLFLIPYLAGLVYLALGLWVYRRRRDHPVGRTFMMLTAAAALALITTFDLLTTHTFARLWSAALPLAGGLLLTFALVFPAEAAPAARRPVLRWAPLLLALPLIAAGQVLFGQPGETLRRVQFGFVAGAAIVFALIMLLRGLLDSAPTVREQSRVVLVGTLLGFAPFVLWAFGLAAVRVEWLVLALLIFPLVLAYSIVQYSVIDTSRAVSFAATYAIMAAVVTLGYALLVAGLNYIAAAIFLTDISAASPLLVGLLGFAIALGFQPLRRWLLTSIDSLFFRSETRFQESLTAFRHQLTLASGLAEVIRLLKQQIREGLMPTHTYIFLRDPQTGDFVATGEGARPDTDIRFDSQSGLVHALSTTRDVIFLEFDKPLPPELLEDHARLAILRTPVIVPLQGQERLAGWVAVGSRRSGEPFSAADLQFVQALAEQASLAVERAQVITDLERRVRELDVLSQVAQAVNFTTDPDALLELIYAQTGKLIDTTNFYIVMHNPELKALSYAFFLEGDERQRDQEEKVWPEDEGLTAEVIRTGRPIRTHDYLSECSRRGVRPRGQRHYAWMGVPLNAGARTLGAMVAASYTPGVTFTDEQLKVFWAIADQAATALDKARLFRETELRARQLATLNEISKELSSTLDLQNLLGLITRAAVDLIGTEAGSLFLVDEASGELEFRVVEGGAQDLVGTRLPAGAGIVGQAASSQAPVIVNDVLQDGRWFSDVDRETSFQTRSLLAVPIIIQDQSIGVLEVINRRDGLPFDEEDARLLTTFGAQAAIAIDNARLYEATDAELARRVDELQNLQRIDRELNRTLQLDRVIHLALEWALRITGASAGLIAMLNAEESGLDILASNGYDAEVMQQFEDTPFPGDRGIIGRVLRTGQPEFIENVSTDADFVSIDQAVTVAQITVPILRGGRPIGALVLESDLPGLLGQQDFEFAQRLVEHAAVAIENARLIQEVQDANRSKTEFISVIAHELKNPMTAIRGYTDLLLGGQVGPINEMQTQFLSTVRSNVDRMTRLVSDLSDVARIETGQMKLEMAPVAVSDIIDETVRDLASQIETRSQTLTLDIPANLPPIQADTVRMVQVMTNLLSNAHKYTPEGGEITIGVRLETETDEESGAAREVIHHWVRDTGIGMSEQEQEKLFTMFFRAAGAKDMAQGTGLGLIITRSLVERHGGRLWVESEPGQGSTFHFTLPAASESPDSA